MLGGADDKGKTKSVLTCSLTELLQSSSSSSSSSMWNRVADAPAYQSTCVAVNEELLAVGGQCEQTVASAATHKYIASAAIYKYNLTTNSWDLISNMPTARYRCLVTVLTTNEIATVGGRVSFDFSRKKVEIASCSFST